MALDGETAGRRAADRRAEPAAAASTAWAGSTTSRTAWSASSRGELYEAPAAVILHDAHRELESLCLSKQAQRFKTLVAQEYADIIYNGLWFSAFHQDLFAFVVSNQRFVSGLVRVKLFKGQGDGRGPQE